MVTKKSRDELLGIIEAWRVAKSIEGFFYEESVLVNSNSFLSCTKTKLADHPPGELCSILLSVLTGTRGALKAGWPNLY